MPLSALLYRLLMATGAMGVFLCLLYRRKRFNLKGWQCLTFSILAVVIAFLGAKVLYNLENWKNGWSSLFYVGGLSLFGSVFLIPMLMPMVGRLFRLHPGQATDICGPCAAVMLGFVRAGCYYSGCCGGWLMQFGERSFRWPTQIVESVGAFAILGWLLQMEEDGKHQGKLYPLFLISYGGLRFIVEFFRDTAKPWLGLAHGQWFGLVAILIGILWIRNIEVKNYDKN